MKRRHFIAGGLAASSALLLPKFASAKGGESSLNHPITKPWQAGFRGVSRPFKSTKLNLEGKWLADAFGNFYRPALVERNKAPLNYLYL
jgi:hypothetical protein